MDKTRKNKWFISLMVGIGMVIGMTISSLINEIIVINKFEKEKITNADNNIKYEDLRRYAKGSHTISSMGE